MERDTERAAPRPTLVPTPPSSLLALGIAFLSLHATAAEPSFCQDPFAAVCARGASRQQARAQSFEALTKGATSLELRRRIFAAEVAATHTAGAEVKRYLKRAIDDELGFPRDLLVESALDEVELVASWQLFALPEVWQGDRASVIPSYHAICGPDGMKDNGFALPVPRDDGTPRTYAMLCPGALLRDDAGGDPRRTLWRSLFLIAHEMGHHLSYQRFPSLYHHLMACMTRRHGREITACSGTPARGLEGAVEELLIHFAALGHMKEIIADYWAARAVGQYLKDHPELTTSERLDVLTEAYGIICNPHEGPHAKTNGSHPNSRFRIGVLLGAKPNVQRAMGCAPAAPGAAARAACELVQGERNR